MIKNWDHHVVHAEEIARRPGFQGLRDRILELAAPRRDETAVDVGSGTGLLALPLAERIERVWAIDLSPLMTHYLQTKAASAGLHNVAPATGTAESLPLVDASVDLVVSNYCFHHLDADGKERALAEAFRVLKPGGRIVFGDMMFSVALREPRDRQLIRAKVFAIGRRGLPGMVRLGRNAMRLARRCWEQPAPAAWWTAALRRAGFENVYVELLEHEGGVAIATRPALLRSARAVDARVAWPRGHGYRARDVDGRPDGAGDQADR